MVPLPSQNTVTVCNQITLLILYYINSGFVTLLEVNDAPIKVTDFFYLTLSSKFINFSFQMFLLFAPEMLVSFTSYIV
jgi:hypothetical protein